MRILQARFTGEIVLGDRSLIHTYVPLFRLVVVFIQHIYELEYNTTSYPKRVVLFYCHWFDPTSRGTRVDPKYGTMEIRMDKSYNLVDLFVSADNVRQVYYVPYPATRRENRGWCVAIKTKPRGYIESNHVQDDVPYKVEEMSHVNEVIGVESIFGLQDLRGESSFVLKYYF